VTAAGAPALRHLARGYPDQPPLVPLAARLATDLAPGSLVALRLPAAFAAAGLVTGLGLFDSDLIALLALAVVAGLAIAGPRQPFRSAWFYAGCLATAVMWLPYLVWQARRGWPELAVARSIAHGNSVTSAPRWLLLPEQLVLLAAGAQPTVEWMRRGRAGLRTGLVAAAVALSLTAIPVTLPVVPVTEVGRTAIVAANYDAGETIGWPAYVRQIGCLRGAAAVPALVGHCAHK
jgi:hypothetical protein